MAKRALILAGALVVLGLATNQAEASFASRFASRSCSVMNTLSRIYDRVADRVATSGADAIEAELEAGDDEGATDISNSYMDFLDRLRQCFSNAVSSVATVADLVVGFLGGNQTTLDNITACETDNLDAIDASYADALITLQGGELIEP